MDYRIRPIRKEEIPVLNDFLYEAIFIPQGVTPPPKSIIQNESLQVYIRGFGQQPDDRCLVAEADNRVVGAIWSRIMNDYGHIADGYKSVSLSVQEANYAMKMYQKAGFKVISDDAEEAIMKCSLIWVIKKKL